MKPSDFGLHPLYERKKLIGLIFDHPIPLSNAIPTLYKKKRKHMIL